MSEHSIWVKRKGNVLVPGDGRSEDAILAMKEGSLIMVRVKTPRNPNQHRLFWHMCRFVYENTDDFTSAEHVAEQIKIGVGYVDRVRLILPDPDGGPPLEVEQVRGKSISFESMPQAEFAPFFERSLDYVVSSLVPQMDRPELESHLMELIAPAT